MFFTMPIPLKLIAGQNGTCFACHAARSPGQNHFWPAQPRAGYPSLTQNFKPNFSCVFHHADSTQIDSRSKWNLFCALCCASAWAKSFLVSPVQGHSWQICVCQRGCPSLTQNFKPNFSYVFRHADSTQIHSRSKWKLFCAPRPPGSWAKSVLASPAQGHSRQIWVCQRGYPSLTQNFKPNFFYAFRHPHSTQTESPSKWKLFCVS